MQTPSQYGGELPYGPPPIHGLAVGSIVSAVVSCCCPFVPAIVAIVLGVIAYGAIRDRPGQYRGSEWAIAGIVIGAVMLVLQLVSLILMSTLGVSKDSITAFLETPPAEVFVENNLPADGEAYLRENNFVDAGERILLYYDDSFMTKFAALSVLTDRRVLTVNEGRAASIRLREVTRVQYVPGSLADSFYIYVNGRGNDRLTLEFSLGADVSGFAQRITELVTMDGGPQLAVE